MKKERSSVAYCFAAGFILDQSIYEFIRAASRNDASSDYEMLKRDVKVRSVRGAYKLTTKACCMVPKIIYRRGTWTRRKTPRTRIMCRAYMFFD